MLLWRPVYKKKLDIRTLIPKGRWLANLLQLCTNILVHICVFAGEFIGMFDIWPVMDKCTVVAKKELFYAWPFGLAAWLCGLIFIDRMNSEKARSVLNEATAYIKQNKVNILHIILSCNVSFI